MFLESDGLPSYQMMRHLDDTALSCICVQILNAGAGLMAAGIAEDLATGVALAKDVHRSGQAQKVLDSWIALSQVFKRLR